MSKVYVTVVRKPTLETLRNIAHGLKLQNKALQVKLQKMEAFNPIRGLETVKIPSK